MGAAELMRKYLNEADPDLLRSMVQSFAEALMSAEASGLCNAEYGEGHRRPVELEERLPIRSSPDIGRNGPWWPWRPVLNRRVSTRRLDDVVKSMGISGISKSQVSELAKSLDESVAPFRNPPLGDWCLMVCWGR
jgi:transposase-like protein